MKTKTTRVKRPRLEKAGTFVNPKDITPICDLVRMTIEAEGHTFEGVAKAAACHPGTVSRLFNGEVRFPRLTTCVSILNALGYRVQIVAAR